MSARLTEQERRFVELRGRGVSDLKLCRELGISHEKAMAMGHAIRGDEPDPGQEGESR